MFDQEVLNDLGSLHSNLWQDLKNEKSKWFFLLILFCETLGLREIGYFNRIAAGLHSGGAASGTMPSRLLSTSQAVLIKLQGPATFSKRFLRIKEMIG